MAKHRYAGVRPHKLSNQEVIARIQRNGITAKDLEREYDRGYLAGNAAGVEWGYDSSIGAVMLALHRVFGFGQKRLARLANAVAEIQIEYCTTEDTFRAVLDESGIDYPRMKDIVKNGGIG